MVQVGLGTMTVYRGSPYQRGHGIGTFLKGLYRVSMPLLRRGASAVGKELLQSGVHFLEDLDNETPAKIAFQQRLKQAQNNLKRKAIDTVFRGKGYKTKKRKKSIQSKRIIRRRKTSAKKKKSRKTVSIRKIKKKSRKTKVRRKRTNNNKNNILDIFG